MARVEYEAKREWLINTVAAMLRLPVDSREDGIQWAQGLSDAVLEHLRTSSRAEVATIYQRMHQAQIAAQNDPEVVAARHQAQVETARRIFEAFFSKNPQVPDNVGTRKALIDRATSLSDDGIINLEHLNEAAQLLIAERTIKPKQILTAAELKQQAVKDLETFKQAAIHLGFATNVANEGLVKQKLGSGYSVSDIARAITNGLQLSPVGEAELEERNESERREIIEEISSTRVMTMQDKAKLDCMTLDQLRAEVAKVREERRLRQMTGSELRAHIRGQQVDRTEKLPDDYTKAQLELMLEIEDGRNTFKDLCKRYGWRAVEERMLGYVKPEIAGVVRTLRHEFDTERV